jgi:hypothetical protein
MTILDSIKKRFIRWDRKFTVSKRQQFVVATGVLTVGLILTQLAGEDLRYPMAIGLSILAYLVSAFVLRDDLKKIEWISLLTLPTLFTAAVSLFYFLLPARWLTRVPVVGLYAVGMYALLLTENIYNVAVDRTIALLRAAHSVGFLLTIVTYFLLVQTVLAFRLPFFLNAIFITIMSFLLVFQSLWAVVLENPVSRRVWHITIVIAVALGQIVWAFSFWPTQTTLVVLFLTTCFYGMVGMAQQYVVEKLYKKTVIEFFSLTSIVFLIVLFATRWRGNL